MKEEKRHVGRPTNEEIKKRTINKIMKLMIPMLIVILIVISLLYGVNEKKLFGETAKQNITQSEIRKLAKEKTPEDANITAVDVNNDRIKIGGIFNLEEGQKFLFADIWFSGKRNNVYRIIGTRLSGNKLITIRFNYPKNVYTVSGNGNTIAIRFYYTDGENYYTFPVRKKLTDEQRMFLDNRLALTTGTLISPIDKNGEIKNIVEAASSKHYKYNSKKKCGSSKTVKRSNCEFHGGNDYAVACKTNIYAVDGGVVTYIHSSNGGGIGKTIGIEATYNGKKYLILYQHLSSIDVVKNQKIKQGEYIAKSGNTGGKYACHLHLEILKGNDINKYKLKPADSKNPYRREQYRVNPWDYIAGDKRGKNYFEE